MLWVTDNPNYPSLKRNYLEGCEELQDVRRQVNEDLMDEYFEENDEDFEETTDDQQEDEQENFK